MHQPVVFPIPPPQQNTSYVDGATSFPYLTFALESKYDVILKHFAFWDLSRLSQDSQIRRAQIYAVSMPGGHPRNWNAILDSCLTLLARAKDDIERQNGRLCGLVDSVRGQNGSEGTRPDISAMLQPKHISLMESKGVRERRLSSGRNGVNIPSANGTSKPTQNLLARVSIFSKAPGAKLNSATDVFENAQLHIWAVEAVSFLIYHSYTEDKLGVVQKDLGEAFGLILDLQSAVERFCRLSGMHQKVFPGISAGYLERMLVRMRQALHSAVYRVHEQFSPYLNSIPLTNNQKIWLNSQHFSRDSQS